MEQSTTTTTMQKNRINLIEDARNLLLSASKLTGEKADALRDEAIQMLDKLLQNANKIQADTFTASKAAADSANNYVKDNPWRMIGATAGLSVLIGFIVARRKHPRPTMKHNEN